MKVNAHTSRRSKWFLTIVVLSIIFQSSPFAISQVKNETIAIGVREGDKTIPLSKRLKIDESRRTTLEIPENSFVEFDLPPDATLTSSNQRSFQVVGANKIFGLLADSSGTLTVASGTTTETFLVVVVKIDLTPSKASAKPDKKTTDDSIHGPLSVLRYEDIKDLYGRDVAKTFIVVQASVHNDELKKKFLVGEMSVDYNLEKCANDIVSRTSDTTVQNDCDKYKDYFKSAGQILETSRKNIAGLADARKYRSPRYIFFQVIDFTGTVGTGLAGFNLLGTDAIKGFSYLVNGFKPAADAALPKLLEQKYQRLSDDIPQQRPIVEPDGYLSINFFIPASAILTYNSWKVYKRSFRDRPPCIPKKKGTSKIPLMTKSVCDDILVDLANFGVERFVEKTLQLNVKGTLIEVSGETKTVTAKSSPDR